LSGGLGGLVIITGGEGGGNGSAGDVRLLGGPGSTTGDGRGGDVVLTAGSATGFEEGGDIRITAGLSQGGNEGGFISLTAGGGGNDGPGGPGGFVNITAGNATFSGEAGGPITLLAGIGNAAGVGGAVTIDAGIGGLTGTGGDASLTSGAGGGIAENSGAVTIASGTAGATSGISGNVTIDTGTAGGTVGDILFNHGGVASFEIDATGSVTGFRAANASGPVMLNEASTVTNPTLIPDKIDVSSGIGGAAGDVSIISGDLETVRFDTGNEVILRQAGTSFQGSNAAGPAITNEAATTTNPTLIPNRAEMDTGWGWASDTLVAVLGSANSYSFSTTEFLVNDKLVTRPVLKDYGLTLATAAVVTGTLTIDYSAGNAQQHTLSEDVTTVTVTNPPASGTYGEIWLRLTQDPASARTVTWAAAFRFPGGSDHVMSAGLGAIDWLHLKTTDGGTNWDVDFQQAYA